MIRKRIVAATVVLLGYVNIANLEANQVFWSDSDDSTLWRANGDGSGSSIILPLQTGAEPRGIAVDAMNGFLYWAENGTNRIRRAGLDGSDPQDVVTSGLGFPADLEIDLAAGKLYWADRDLDIIRRANLDGSGAETVVSVPAPGNNAAPYFLELDPDRGKLYWSDFDSGVIHRANLDGSSGESFVSGLDRVRDIEILNDMIYWTDRDTRLVQRQNLNGTQRETLYGPSGLVLPHGLALDSASGFLYIADADGGQVYRGPLDGTGSLQTIGSTGLQNPWDVAIVVQTQGGDFNRDGAVDAADYVVWRNGDATLQEYEIWRTNFGKEQANSADVARGEVPEPRASSLVALGLLSTVLFRRPQAIRVPVAPYPNLTSKRPRFVDNSELLSGETFVRVSYTLPTKRMSSLLVIHSRPTRLGRVLVSAPGSDADTPRPGVFLQGSTTAGTLHPSGLLLRCHLRRITMDATAKGSTRSRLVDILGLARHIGRP